MRYSPKSAESDVGLISWITSIVSSLKRRKKRKEEKKKKKKERDEEEEEVEEEEEKERKKKEEKKIIITQFHVHVTMSKLISSGWCTVFRILDIK